MLRLGIGRVDRNRLVAQAVGEFAEPQRGIRVVDLAQALPQQAANAAADGPIRHQIVGKQKIDHEVFLGNQGKKAGVVCW